MFACLTHSHLRSHCLVIGLWSVAHDWLTETCDACSSLVAGHKFAVFFCANHSEPGGMSVARVDLLLTSAGLLSACNRCVTADLLRPKACYSAYTLAKRPTSLQDQALVQADLICVSGLQAVLDPDLSEIVPANLAPSSETTEADAVKDNNSKAGVVVPGASEADIKSGVDNTINSNGSGMAAKLSKLASFPARTASLLKRSPVGSGVAKGPRVSSCYNLSWHVHGLTGQMRIRS